MRLLVPFLLCFLRFCEASSHTALYFSFFSSASSNVQPHRPVQLQHHHPVHPFEKGASADLASAPAGPHGMKHGISSAPLASPAPFGLAPSLSPTFRGDYPRHHHHHRKGSWSSSRHHHHHKPGAHPPSVFDPDCSGISCSDPLTTTPIGSPCGCVLPLQVELDLEVAPFRVFTVVPELEIEVAAGTYVKQSQVKIMSAAANGPDKTRVDIDLVPLGEKFDNMSAFLIYERFWEKKVPINASIFGNYEVIYVRYPGLPSPPPSMPPGAHQLPIIAHVPPGKTRKINARIIAIIALTSLIVLLVIIVLVFIISKWCKSGKSCLPVAPALHSTINKRSGLRSMMSSSIASSTSFSLNSTMPTCPPSVKTFTLAELELATDKFSSKKILGEGGFGCVYHGTTNDGTEIAVKMLREDRNGVREFIAEVEMLSRLHHRNLVKLIGICIEGSATCLIYELIRNGSVESHLHGASKTNSPDWDTRMKIALGAARGLAYLHEDSNPRVIHRDFKASNILLEDDFTPKVSDFGLAREASEGNHHISTRVMGTFGYVAPEYAMTGHLLVESDVYSYGVVLLELLSGRKPVDMSQPEGQENLVTWARPLLTSREGLQQLVDPSLGGNYDIENVRKVARIAYMCVEPNASHRPFMGEVVQILKSICNDANDACEDSCSQRESSALDGDFRGETGGGSSWWNEGTPPRLNFGYASSFVTLEYSSGQFEEMKRPHSTSYLIGRREPLARHNRSGPMRSIRDFARLRGSMSEHGFLSRHFDLDGNWV